MGGPFAVPRLRPWQRAALTRWDELGRPDDYLVTATPGAGKTTFALTFAARLLTARHVSRVIVVVPTDHLRTQWAEAAARFNIRLDPNLDNTTRRPGRDFHGCVVTYAQVATKPALHMARTQEAATLVILDEVHHGGDGLSWGDAVSDAFGPARKRLSLTGTPFRTSATETIPFVTYETEPDGSARSVADYTFGYREALRDGVVRPTMFAAYSGVARWRDSAANVLTASLSEPLTKDMEAAAWRTVLSPNGAWIPHVIAAADARLNRVRAAGMRDAGAMMLASDQDAARAYADVIHDLTGIKPVVALSDDPKASKKIAAYAASRDRWLVAVRMVSEGVDIPRLAVGVWATAYRTPLFFAQAVGRFVRARQPGETATIFLPAVRPLLQLAADVEDERDHVLAPPDRDDDDDARVRVDAPDGSDTDGFTALGADAEFAHVLYGGAAHTGMTVPDLSDEEQDFLGLPGLLDPDMMATLLRQRETQLRSHTVRTGKNRDGTSQDASPSAHEEAVTLRKEIASLVARYAARTGIPHAAVHRLARKHAPGPAVKKATIEQLRARRDYLMSIT